MELDSTKQQDAMAFTCMAESSTLLDICCKGEKVRISLQSASRPHSFGKQGDGRSTIRACSERLVHDMEAEPT
jgi:hypothetical protein